MGRVPLFAAYGLLFIMATPVGGRAQPARDTPLVEVDPIRCWWRTTEGAVAVGQTFSVVLTCAVVEHDRVRVVPDESQLAVETIQLAPFEIIGGSHPPDLRSGARRFFQYDYTVRIIDPHAIGRDVALPPLQIHYRVESRVQAQALEGRDRVYVLPAETVRVVSMVPANARDIRDGATHLFGALEGYRFRARVYDLVAIALLTLGVVSVLPAAVRAFRGAAAQPKSVAPRAADHAVLGAAVAALADAQARGRAGWTADFLARALAATRVAAGYAIGKPARQMTMGANGEAAAERLLVEQGLIRKRRVTVSSATTAEELRRELEGGVNGAGRARLDGLHESLAALTAAAYGRDAAPSAGVDGEAGVAIDVDRAVANALAAARGLRREHSMACAVLKRVGLRR